MITVGIIGNGFVGKATALFKCKEIKCLVYDKKSELSEVESLSDLKLCDVIFICVPTPSNENGDCDTSIVESILQYLTEYKAIIIIRSTVPIGFCAKYKDVCFMPEFLTEKNWRNDFFNNNLWIFGGRDEKFKRIMTSLIYTAFANERIKHTNMAFMTTSEAEAVKYFRNAFLATKIAFCNEFFKGLKDINYSIVQQYACQDPRIGPSHTDVPGHDGHFGFGGTCLPKDTVSLRNQFGYPPLLSAVVHRNEAIDRSERDWEKDIGRAVKSNEQRILITGGAGFIGTNLAKYLLNRGEKILVIDNFSSGKNKIPNITYLEMDICNAPVNLKNIKSIYHLACPASPEKYQKDPIQTIKTCIDGSLKVLELAKFNKCPVLLTSTSEVYGEPLVSPQEEKYRGNVNTVGIRSCYDEGKRLAETLFFEYRRQGIDTKIVRVFNTYGPYMDQDDGRVVTNFLKQAKNGDDITIYGDGSQTRSFCYIDDMIRGLEAMMNSKEHGPINLGNPTEQSVLSIAKKILEITGSSSKLVFKQLPQDDPTNRCPDITLAKEKLGWYPKISFEQGIVKMLAFDSY